MIDTPTAADAGTYSLAAVNECGTVISPSANLVVSNGPQTVLYPHQVIVCAGESVTFTPDADGAGELTYQWLMEEGMIAGATDSTYTIDAADPSDAGAYLVRVTDDCGSAFSNLAFLIVDEACP